MSVLSFLFKDKSDDAEPTRGEEAALGMNSSASSALATEAQSEPAGEVLDFDEIRNALDQIAEVLGRGEGYDMLKTSSGDVTALELPLADLMEVVPSAFCAGAPETADEDKKVTVLIENIFGQLGAGRIEATVHDLVADVPADYLPADIAARYEEKVLLPLPLVVNAISPEELKKRTTNVERDTGINDLPNLFSAEGLDDQPDTAENAAVEAELEEIMSKEPAAPVAAEPVVQEEKPAPAADVAAYPPEAPAAATLHADVDEEAPAVDVPPAPVPEAPEVGERVQAPAEHALMLRGLDLNTASAQALVARLDGVGPRLAERIVRNRQTQGPFLDVLDLARVPGLGRKTFTKITGMRWPEGEEALPEMRQNILTFSQAGFLSVKDVAARFGQLAGFEGCLVAHQDGYVLATSWEHKAHEALGAFAPQIFKKVARYVRRLDLGDMECMTVVLDQRPITLVPSEDIYFVAVHKTGGLSRKHVRLAHGVGRRLGRLLKRRNMAAA